MKVVYASSLEVGGPLTHLLDLAPAVARQGVDVTVLCASDRLAEAFRSRGVAAASVPLQSRADVPGVLRVRPYLRDADLVHTHDRRTSFLVRPTAGLGGATVVHTLHGLPRGLTSSLVPADRELPEADDAGLADRARLRAEALLSRIGVTVVPSRALARYLATHGFEPGRLRVIPNAVTVCRQRPRDAGDVVVVGTAAVLEPLKGIDLLIDACAGADVELRLEIFGDGSARPDLEARSRRAGVAAHFHGHVENASDRFGELDLFVLPSWSENLPMAILEAMAWALPVVATRVGGVPEAVLDGETGLLVEAGDRDGLAASIETLVRDPVRRASLGAAGAARIAAEYDSAAVASRMVGMYEELLARGGGR
ncbi:MAG TPA: glycosyltransferase family 4 protein [Gaiellaceae bacterium]